MIILYIPEAFPPSAQPFRQGRKGNDITGSDRAGERIRRVAVRMVFVVTLSALMVTVLFCSGPYSSAEDRQQTVPALSLWAPGQAEWGCVGLGMTSVTVDFVPQNDVIVLFLFLRFYLNHILNRIYTDALQC